MKYADFIASKSQKTLLHGFEPDFLPDFLFDFQRDLVEWAVRKGRAAIFADCGLGKTPMELVWAFNVVRHTNGRVLILAPLSVSQQIVREGEKFCIDVSRSRDGKPAGDITVTNYERIESFTPEDYAGVVCDESSILKNFSGKRRTLVTEFMRTRPYRLLATATAAPNDWVELGTSSESLGELGYMDMLSKFQERSRNEPSEPQLVGRQMAVPGSFRTRLLAMGMLLGAGLAPAVGPGIRRWQVPFA